MMLRTDLFLIEYLKKLNLRIIELKNEKGYTLLHLAVLNNKADAIYALVHFARDT